MNLKGSGEIIERPKLDIEGISHGKRLREGDRTCESKTINFTQSLYTPLNHLFIWDPFPTPIVKQKIY